MTVLLEFRNVGKSFGGLRATDDVSFAVNTGEIVGLIGPNGAGKTTLFALASGFLAPTDGSIWFGGERVDGLGPPEICTRGLVRTFQVVKPFGEMTVLENVMIGAFLRERHPERAPRVGLAQPHRAEHVRRLGYASLAGGACRDRELRDIQQKK